MLGILRTDQSNTSIIILNVNDTNIPIKKQRLLKLKARSSYVLPYKIHPNCKYPNGLK